MTESSLSLGRCFRSCAIAGGPPDTPRWQKSLFLKHTGPSGHGMGPAAGEALARAGGAEEVKVFVVEGEGGLTPGGAHEAKHTAWGLGLSNLVFLVDWNDFGIDPPPRVECCKRLTGRLGSPRRLARHRHRAGIGVGACDEGRARGPCAVPTRRYAERGLVQDPQGEGLRKVRRFVADGSPSAHTFRAVLTLRAVRHGGHGVENAGVDEPAPADPEALAREEEFNLKVTMSVLRRDKGLVDWLSDRLIRRIADTVPAAVEGFRLGKKSSKVFSDQRVFDFEHYPSGMWSAGEKAPNRLPREWQARRSCVTAPAMRSVSRRRGGRSTCSCCRRFPTPVEPEKPVRTHMADRCRRVSLYGAAGRSRCR